MRVVGMGWVVSVWLTFGGSVARAYDADVPLFMQAYDLGPEVEAVLKGVHLDPARLRGVILAAPVTVPLPPVPAGLGPILLDPPKRTAEARPVTLPPLGGGVAVAPISLPAPAAGPVAPNVQAAVGQLLLSRGEATPEVLDSLRDLPRATLLARLERVRPTDRPVGAADGLVSLLVEGGHVRVGALGDLTPRARYHVAAWLARRGDGRCVGALEALLAARGVKLNQGPVPELEALAGYYRLQRRHREAAATWLRAPTQTTASATIANYTVEAARDLARAGDAAGSAAAYQRARGYGYGWATGLVLCDLATALADTQQYDAALRVLDEPVTGRSADQILIAVEYHRARIHEAAGDAAAAQRAWAACLARRRAVGQLLANEGLEGVVTQARQRLAATASGRESTAVREVRP